MRTKNSIKNSLTSLLSSILSIVIGFIAQAIFIKILGIEYLGLNGLFSNILNMLNVFELGIGSTIIFNLYLPIAKKDEDSIKKYLYFYKKSYNIIAVVILTIGLLILPFINYFVEEITVKVNIYIIYFLSLISTVVSYILTYKRSIIIADQKSYIVYIVHSIYLIVLNILQLCFLYITKNFYIYLFIKIVCQLFENIIITIIANKKYKFLTNNKKVSNLEKQEEKNILKNVKSLFLHKIGSALVFSSDNIIISKEFGISSVGYYTNYSMIICTIANLFSKMLSATTASVGNLCISDNNSKKYEVFKKIQFINYILSSFSAICLLYLIQPFISIWIGKKYLLSESIVIILIISYFLTSFRTVFGIYRDSNGTWSHDKWIPIVEAIANIIFSIILAKIYGLSGVFIGTIISGLIWWVYGFPKYVYSPLFKRKFSQYYKEILTYILNFTITIITCSIAILPLKINNDLEKLIINSIIIIIVYSVITIVLFHQKEEYKYFYSNLINLIKGRNNDEKNNKKDL